MARVAQISDGFKFPKKKYTAKMKKATSFPTYYEGNDSDKHHKSVEEYIKFIERTAIVLERSQLYADIRQALANHRVSSAPIQNIVALGMGSFTSMSCVLQFCCLVCLSRHAFHSIILAFLDMKVQIFDPLMSQIEREVATHYRFKVSRDNLYGKYDTSKLGLHCFTCLTALIVSTTMSFEELNALDTFQFLQ